LVDQIAALAWRPAWLFQVHEAEIEGTVPLEHRNTLGLGGVRGDHGLDVEGRENGPDLVGRDPGRRGAAHHLCERAPELLVAPLATRVSCLALPRCGSSTTFSIVRSSGLMAGSRSYTSRPAPAMVRALSAATSACSSTTSPRAVLMRNAPGFISLRRRASIRCRVSGVAGQCSDTKSASRTTSSTLGRAVA